MDGDWLANPILAHKLKQVRLQPCKNRMQCAAKRRVRGPGASGHGRSGWKTQRPRPGFSAQKNRMAGGLSIAFRFFSESTGKSGTSTQENGCHWRRQAGRTRSRNAVRRLFPDSSRSEELSHSAARIEVQREKEFISATGELCMMVFCASERVQEPFYKIGFGVVRRAVAQVDSDPGAQEKGELSPCSHPSAVFIRCIAVWGACVAF
jgi:hypothetical protein